MRCQLKKHINRDNIKYTVTTLLFIIIVAYIGVKTIYINFDEMKKDLGEAQDVAQVIASLEHTYDDELFQYQQFIDLWSVSQVVIHTHLFDDVEYGSIIKDMQGKLHFPYDWCDVSPYVDSTLEFAKTLDEMDVPFYYVQAPNKKLKDYTKFPAGGVNESNEVADAYLSALTQNGIQTLDLREEIIKDNLDRSELFYVTDHHWTTPTAFWAFQKLVSHLDLNLDPQGFYTDPSNYQFTQYDNCYLGSLGRRVGKFVAGLDDYTLIEPTFETRYSIYNGIESKDKPIFQGTFRDCIIRPELLQCDDITLNKHAAYFGWDYGDLIIQNHAVKNNKKILLIKDSFSLPLAAFLSTCVSELHMLDLRDEQTPIPSEYIKQYDFDAVIVLYNTEVFTPTMFHFLGTQNN